MSANSGTVFLRVSEGGKKRHGLQLWERVADTWSVLLGNAVVSGIDPKRTEGFLLSHHDVLDASVWLSDGRLQAHVTVADDAAIDQRELQMACLDSLGLHQTPASILLIQARPWAA